MAKPVLGVSIDVLRNVARLYGQSYGAKPNPQTSDISEVVGKITEAHKCSYAAFLLKTSSHGIAPATCFVSHAWRYDFADLMECIESHNKKHEDTKQYYWIDFVCNDLHDSSSKPFEWWTGTFKDSIERIGHVLLVITPWDSPISLKRVWCLFEMFTALTLEETRGTTIEVERPSAQNHAFYTFVMRNEGSSHGRILRKLVALDVNKAEATRPSDKDGIFRVIQQEEDGVRTLNTRVKRLVRRWVLAMCEEIVARGDPDDQLLRNLASVANRLGFRERALGMLTRAVAHAERHFPPSHARVGQALLALGAEEALGGGRHRATADINNHLRHAWEIFQAAQPREPKDVADVCAVLASVYSFKYEWDNVFTYAHNAIAEDPTNVDLHLRVARCLAYSRPEQALGILGMAQKLLERYDGESATTSSTDALRRSISSSVHADDDDDDDDEGPNAFTSFLIRLHHTGALAFISLRRYDDAERSLKAAVELLGDCTSLKLSVLLMDLAEVMITLIFEILGFFLKKNFYY